MLCVLNGVNFDIFVKILKPQRGKKSVPTDLNIFNLEMSLGLKTSEQVKLRSNLMNDLYFRSKDEEEISFYFAVIAMPILDRYLGKVMCVWPNSGGCICVTVVGL